MYTPSGLKSKTFNHAHLHYHLGQSRPHQKTITHTHGLPPQPLKPDKVFLGGGEGLIRPPLARLYGEMVPAEEKFFICRGKSDQSAKKINKYG